MINIWKENSGYNLANTEEGIVINLPLPTVGDISAITFSIISGKLPGGLRLTNNRIIGTVREVSRPTTFSFVIRATDGIEISDRTFSITVEGYDDPQWLTPDGSLRLTTNNLTFVLDGTYVEYQLNAIDNDLPAGDSLEFFIAEDDGELPSGLTLTTDGRITGFVDPILALDISAGEGYFDTNFFDSNIYDLGLRPNTGMDTYLFDSLVFDYFDTMRPPKKLNRTYEFIVSVSDGETIVKRQFKIFVVGDDFLRADNLIMQVGTGTFTADNTYLRSPIWLTPSNLGVRRANNFVTVFLDTFDPNRFTGPVVYELADQNDDLSESILPDGMFLDSQTGELFGFSPYQPAVTKEYKFTINATKYDRDSITLVDIQVSLYDGAQSGDRFIKIYPLISSTEINRLVNDVLRIDNYYYRITSYEGPEVTGARYAILRLDRALLTSFSSKDTNGNIVTFTKTYYESTLSFNTMVSPKTFVISILGEIDSVIKYVTPSDLGSLKANYASTVSVVATTTVPNAILSYRLISGSLPPGMQLSATGDIIGKVTQFGDSNRLGLTSFDGGQTTFDGRNTTFDRVYKFTILASDQFKYSAVLGSFSLTIIDLDKRLYSNVYVRPFQKRIKRDIFYNFINDGEIFTPSKIYRPSDPQFGVQYDLKMLMYAGIETTNINDYVRAMVNNHKKKRFRLGEPKIAIAKLQGQTEVLYDVIYLEVFDDYEKGNVSASRSIKLRNNINSPLLINQARLDFNDFYPQISTTVKKIGNGSIAFDGSNSSLNVSKRLTDFIGPGDFTYETWVRFNNITDTMAIFDQSSSIGSNTSINLFLKDGTIQLFQGEYKNFGGTWAANIWYHIAVVRQGSNYKLYKDGVLVSTVTGHSGALTCKKFNIGLANDNLTLGFNGYMDEIRVSNVARYTNNFTAPTTEFEPDRNSILLIHSNGRNKSSVFWDHVDAIRKPKIIFSSGYVDKFGTQSPYDFNINPVDKFRPSRAPATADNTTVKVSGTNLETIYPVSIKNMRENLKELQVKENNAFRTLVTENEYLPLWMLTPQNNRTAATGFINAIPICYCKPGEGQYILDNIKNSNFDFTTIDYEIDRYIIDATTGNSTDQYLSFTNYRYNI